MLLVEDSVAVIADRIHGCPHVTVGSFKCVVSSAISSTADAPGLLLQFGPCYACTLKV